MSAPVVHCITNHVTAARVADALVALGAQPILAGAADEVAEVTRSAGAVVLNCGTPSADRFAAMRAAALEARASGRPVVLDPVGCGGSEWRTRRIRELAHDAGPAVVRGNVAEVAALAAVAGPPLRGIRSDPADEPGVERIARAARDALGTVVLATGRGTDVAAGPTSSHALCVDAAVLDRVVGAGDVLSAMVGAFLARGDDPLAAALGAHASFAAAARAAADRGPGAFWAAFIDALAAHG